MRYVEPIIHESFIGENMYFLFQWYIGELYEETSKETSISLLLIVNPWTLLTSSKVSAIFYCLIERGLSLLASLAKVVRVSSGQNRSHG